MKQEKQKLLHKMEKEINENSQPIDTDELTKKLKMKRRDYNKMTRK